MYNVYNVPKDRKWTPEQSAYLERLGISLQDTYRALADAADASVKATIAELEQYTLPEILNALRRTYGAKPDPTRRLELLQDKNGKLPKHVSMQKAREYARVTQRRLDKLMKDDRLRYVGAKGHRRILTEDLKAFWPPEK